MKLTTEIIEAMDRSVLCWLATVSAAHIPNVSPKEIFSHYNSEHIIIANIASPQSVRNIKQNSAVCLSFIDILVQKGFQIKGNAALITKTDLEFGKMAAVLLKMTEGKFPFSTITKITVDQIKPIIAPSYLFYPETTEKQQIANAKKAYKM